MTTSAASSTRDEQVNPGLKMTPLSRLPEPLTSFIGREREISEIHQMLTDGRTRLLTLTGPGGVGKTRLAIEVAKARWAESAVVFIPLASVRDPSLVAATIGAAFDLSDSGEQSLAERLPTVLQDSPLLLVLDNFEHVADAAPIASLLLGACSTLKILATSRRPLHVSGEIDYAVPPLGTAGPNASREIVEQSASWRLFVERSPGGACGANGTPHAAESEAISEICRRLDGLPLAIELAAARTRVLPPSELLARLDERFALLTGGPVDAPTRLQNMRDAIGWSYELLSINEQRLLRYLSVFSGGFTLEAVEAVAPDELQTPALDLLTRLIDHSLVRRMETTAPNARFTMLETIREFALDALNSQDEETDARDRHLAWMIAFVGSPTPERFDERRGPADAPLYDELDNLRLALSWAIESQDAPRAAQVAWGMLRIWWHYGLTSEALESARRIAEQPEGLDPFVHATAFGWVAALAHECGNDELGRIAAARAIELYKAVAYEPGINSSLWVLAQSTMWSDPVTALELFSQAVDHGRELGDDRTLACDLLGRSWAFITLGDGQRALSDLAEALPLYERYRDDDEVRYEHSLAMNFSAWASGMHGQFDQASRMVEQGHAYAQKFNVGIGLFSANRVLGELARQRGNVQRASKHLRDALLAAHREALETMKVFVTTQIAMLAQAAGDYPRAARLFGYVGAYWERFQFAESTRSIATWGYTTDPTRVALGEVTFAAALEAGYGLTSAEAFVEASEFTVPDDVRRNRSTLLTRRETETLAHLAQGKTNQEIAAELFVGKSTVDTHVAHILAKLGVDSRREAVRVAEERGQLSQ